MTFDEQYPDARRNSEPRAGIWRAPSGEGPCFWCRRTTSWIELNYEAWVCGEPCERAMDADANSRSPKGPPKHRQTR